jgi:hypothetical protein
VIFLFVLRLAIQAELCGPVSIGTVAVVRVMRDQLGLPTGVATALVERCVFDGEIVNLSVNSREIADRFVQALAALPSGPRVSVELSDA